MARSLTAEADFDAESAAAFAAFSEALAAHPGGRVVSADPASGTILGATRMGLRSYGERIEISIRPTGPGRTHVSVTSKLRFVQLVDWGKNRTNVDLIMGAARARLLGRSAGSPPSLPPPPPPPADPGRGD